jgi:hypothetical protein
VSLLDDGPDTLLVYAETTGDDGDGNPIRVPDTHPRRIQGRVQPASAEETQDKGYAAGTYYRFITRCFPAGAWSRVQWCGRDWDVEGEPLTSGGSEATRHVTVMLKARTLREA